MGFASVRTFAEAQEFTGAEWYSFFHKTGSPALPAAGLWADLSMAAGTPKYNAYVGTQAEGTPLVSTGNFGLYLPGVSSGATRHISEVNIGTVSATFAPATFSLCDYVYHYPLVDMDSTDLQAFDNSQASVPRYADGNGLRIMVVTTTPQSGVSVQCNVVYTNQSGGTSSTSFWTYGGGVTNVGNINVCANSGGAASGMTAFVPLASGDTGVQNIQNITNLASGGGFCAFVLVRPLLQVQLREQNTVAEVNYLLHRRQMPRAYDGAYLNWIFTSGATAVSSSIRGFVKFGWN